MDWLIDWLRNEWMFDWSIEWLIDWFLVWCTVPIDWLIDCMNLLVYQKRIGWSFFFLFTVFQWQARDLSKWTTTGSPSTPWEAVGCRKCGSHSKKRTKRNTPWKFYRKRSCKIIISFSGECSATGGPRVLRAQPGFAFGHKVQSAGKRSGNLFFYWFSRSGLLFLQDFAESPGGSVPRNRHTATVESSEYHQSGGSRGQAHGWVHLHCFRAFGPGSDGYSHRCVHFDIIERNKKHRHDFSIPFIFNHRLRRNLMRFHPAALCRLIDWLVDWLIDKSIGWSIGWLINRSVDWLIGWNIFTIVRSFCRLERNLETWSAFCSLGWGGIAQFLFLGLRRKSLKHLQTTTSRFFPHLNYAVTELCCVFFNRDG